MNDSNLQQIIHPSLLKRKIIHFDLDAFFAAVEIRDNPRLKGQPLIIGGMPNERGVVATASYEARKFGIHSAMSSAQAKKLCPQAIFLKPRFDAYSSASAEVFKILTNYCSIIEPMSLDEAYLDVTNISHQTSATKIAENIRHEIFLKTKLTASAGIAPNKMIAKIASDLNKPNGFAVIKPQFCFPFMQTLPLKKVPFIGPVTSRKFASHNLFTCSDVFRIGKNYIIENFGPNAEWVYDKACGIDESEVITTHVRKSYGEEETFIKDIINYSDKINMLKKMVASLSEYLLKKNISFKTVTIKIKYSNFTVKTKSKSFPLYFFEKNILEKISLQFLEEMNCEKVPLRLMGVSVSNVINKKDLQQETLFGDYI